MHASYQHVINEPEQYAHSMAPLGGFIDIVRHTCSKARRRNQVTGGAGVIIRIDIFRQHSDEGNFPMATNADLTR